MPKPFVRVVACATTICAMFAPAAGAAPNCAPKLPAVVPLYTGGGVLESVIVDKHGQLFFSDSTAGKLMRIDKPGAKPDVVATGLPNPGGLAFDRDQRYLFVGVGNGFQGGAIGNVAPAAKLMRVDLKTGRSTVYATGLRMANGVARAPDGSIYASTDVGLGIDRISPTGVVQNDWAKVVSGNGMVIDPGGHWLYVNQTFVPAAIQRISLDHPGTPPQTYARPSLLDVAAGLDGLTMDPKGRLVAAANSGLSVVRVNADRSFCTLGQNLLLPSAVAYGHGKTGFASGHLYAVTFTGGVFEVPGGYVAPGP